MSEHVRLYQESEYTVDQNAETAISSIVLTNFNEIPDANGYFGTNKPTVTINLSEFDNDPTGFTFCWDFGLDNWPLSCTVRMVYENSAVQYTFGPQNPMMTDDWNVWGGQGRLLRIICTVNRSRIGCMKLRFGGFHFGEEMLDFTSGLADNLNIKQNIDLSGITAPYAVLTATVTGRALENYVKRNEKFVVATELKRIGEYYVQSLTSTSRNSTGVNKYAFEAYSILGVLATEDYEGHVHSPYAQEETYDMFDTIVNGVNGITRNRLYISPPYQYCYPNIEQGVDRRQALAAVALSCNRCVDPYGNLYDIGGDHNNSIVIPTSRIYENPTITDRGTFAKIKIQAYDFYRTDPDDCHDTSVQETYGVLDQQSGNHQTPVTKAGTELKAKDETWCVYLSDDITATWNGDQNLTFKSFAIPGQWCGTNSPYPSQSTLELIKQYYYRRLVWTGKVLWNTSTDECRLGKRVWVYKQDGTVFPGTVIESNLNFSAGSVRADMKVLRDFTV